VIRVYLFIYNEIVHEYTEYKEKQKMNKELNYDTHNDSIIRSMSAEPKIKSSA